MAASIVQHDRSVSRDNRGQFNVAIGNAAAIAAHLFGRLDYVRSKYLLIDAWDIEVLKTLISVG